MKKSIFAALLGLTLLIATACGQKNDRTDTHASAADSTAAQTVNAENNSSAMSSAAPSDNSISVSLPAVEEATFLSTKDYTYTLVQRYIDVHKLSDKTKQYVVDILNGDTVTIATSGTIQIAPGISTQFSGVMAANGDKRYLKTNIAGRNTVMLRNESGTYTLNEEQSVAQKTDVSADNISDNTQKGSPFYQNQGAVQLFTSVMAGFGQDPLTYVQSGAEVFEGKPLTFEEYAVGSIAIKLYYDGNTLQYVTFDKGTLSSVITIHTLTDTADPALFQIPDGYTVQ